MFCAARRKSLSGCEVSQFVMSKKVDDEVQGYWMGNNHKSKIDYSWQKGVNAGPRRTLSSSLFGVWTKGGRTGRGGFTSWDHRWWIVPLSPSMYALLSSFYLFSRKRKYSYSVVFIINYSDKSVLIHWFNRIGVFALFFHVCVIPVFSFTTPYSIALPPAHLARNLSSRITPLLP